MNNLPRGNAPTPMRRAMPRMTLSQMGGGSPIPKPETPFSNFSRFVDPSGKLNFNGKAILHADGVDFSNGNSFKINMEELKLLEELGKGQYGTVQKVYHKPTNVTMAMKEIRLELDQSKLNSILMELDVLHKSASPYIVEFYGAFFIETCVYYCMEFMDAGSLDKLYQIGVPEDILSHITRSMVRGLKFLKDDLSIIHRDVKPTNVLVNSKGQVKLCDFGVSGQLVQSMAKTHIGCQSYMAPERISQGHTYTVQSDVWSLGLSILETAEGSYPYPPEKYNSVFAQLAAIVESPPPSLPESYSQDARDFVALCLLKDAKERPAYKALLEHPFLSKYGEDEVDMKSWAVKAMEARIAREEAAKNAPAAPPSS
ncbi:mitogen-activated protein kinase kinase [Entomortierella parvispora]|uniref:mitogen-activated protein kinase kinase n=1 Tax=Entomortierella parvispora TaxID=205924 RepID=A0A9P3HLW1_9FUNG|nr:mitogen-activated protein kinase kinase [Entomortierella parvispora]